MDLIYIVGTTLRRWYVALPVMIVAGLSLFLVRASLPTVYQTATTGLVIGPQQSIIGTSVVEVNPFVYLADSVKVMAIAASSVANSQEVQDRLAAEGFDADYVVSVQPGTSFIDVKVSGTDRATTERTTDRVLQEVSNLIGGFQARSPEGQRMSVQVLQKPNVFEAAPDSSQRLQLVIVGLGVAAAIGGAVGVDLVLARRAARAGRPLPGSSPASELSARREPEPSGGPELTGGGDVSPDTMRLNAFHEGLPRPSGSGRNWDEDDALARSSAPRKP